MTCAGYWKGGKGIKKEWDLQDGCLESQYIEMDGEAGETHDEREERCEGFWMEN